MVLMAYLPSETPAPLIPYREEDLANLRGNGSGQLKDCDRVYDYACYNDLGDPDKGPQYARPNLGGSADYPYPRRGRTSRPPNKKDYPYPRRGRTSRPPNKKDPGTESKLPLVQSLSVYVPRDEQFNNSKFLEFLTNGAKIIIQFLDPGFKSILDSTPAEFDSFKDVHKIYEGVIKLPQSSLLDTIKASVSRTSSKDLQTTDGEGYDSFPKPQLIKEDKFAWGSDEEFGRETLAGFNHVSIHRLEEFPPTSKLDPNVYGNQKSTISEDQIKNNLDGLTVQEAIKNNQVFILDFHDALMPYLGRINKTTSKVYATRTLLFLQKDGTLKPLAIELSVPHPDGDQYGAVSKVFTPAKEGVEASVWSLAKAYVAANDFGIHELISHWLNTHAVVEPFIISTDRQLSAVHPIHKLLQPHFCDTMYINALARQILINNGGLFRSLFCPGKYSAELSSAVYKDWVFTEQALSADLIKRGVAVKDTNAPHGLKLLIEDYHYAVDGLKIWSAIETWVRESCSIYYKNDDIVRKDKELQSWWKEVREVGHGDKKDEPCWPKMQSREDLIVSCTIIIWVASALHAAVNFGQYTYGGFLLNRPPTSRRLMPEPGTPEYEELKENPEKVFLKTITPQVEALVLISVVEILSRHTSDEVYLGQRDTPEWTQDKEAVEALGKFEKKLGEIEKEIVKMNSDEKWKNRVGPGKVPYTLLHPSSEVGLTGKGIPNSISI